MSILSREDLVGLLHYAPDSGDFTWRVRPAAGVPEGSVAGTTLKSGYRSIRIGRAGYRAHRLAFLYMTGHWPAGDVDHIDGDRANNRWANLREATRSQNMANRGATRTNPTGTKGVCWDEQRHGWRAAITVDRKRIHLGIFGDAAQAQEAYWLAARQHFGQFARK